MGALGLGQLDLASEAGPTERPSLQSRAAVTTFVPGRLLQDCYILDQSGTKIYVWKGRGATKGEKQMAMSKALVGAVGGQHYPTSPSTTHQRCSESVLGTGAQNVAVRAMTSKSHRQTEVQIHV